MDILIESPAPTRYSAPVKHAFVDTNILDLRGEPSHQSERLSQLFFADTVAVIEDKSGFARIRQADGYAGWVDSRLLTAISAQQAITYRKKLNGVIATPQAPLLDLPEGTTVPPHFLYYGTPVHVRSRRGKFAVILTPDLKRYLVRETALKSVDFKRRARLSGANLILEAKRFLGVPYLWGGITPAGFDCSGLVRTVCGRFGIYLPRDTKDQIEVGRHIERSEVKTGDLLFFKRHVGFAIGNDRIIHASRGGAGVRVNSLKTGAMDYRPDLDHDFQQARRILL
jgi:gamma-D-glutamyl-L-lysine dipeptidyl-peptidase